METSSRTKLFAVVSLLVLAFAAYWWLGRSAPSPGDDKPAKPTASVEDERNEAPVRRPAVSVAPPVSIPRPAKTTTPGLVASAAWGSGRTDIGREVPEEGNPEGPMSFAFGPDGSLIVLDQVNNRLARYDKDGSRLSDTNLDSVYPQDVAVGQDGTTAVLDRLKDKNVTLLDPEGRPVGSLPLEGEAIGETGGITGVFVDGDDVWVEREHGTLVKVGKTDGTVAEEPEEMPGRPSRDGTLLLTAGIVEAPAGRIFVSAIDRGTRDHQFTREIRLEDAVLYLVLLDSDKLGTIYVAGVIGSPEPPPGNVQVQLVCLEPTTGAPIGGAFLPASDLPDETFRELVVLDEGGVVYAERTSEGIVYRVYHCS